MTKKKEELEKVDRLELCILPIEQELDNISGGDKFERHDIERGLRKLPALINNQAMRVAEARETRDRIEIQKKIAIARLITEDDNIKSCNATDKKAYSELHTKEESLILTVAEYNLAVQEILLKKYEDYFTSIRKQAYFELADMEAMSKAVTMKHGEGPNR